jgi:hypothetical protein
MRGRRTEMANAVSRLWSGFFCGRHLGERVEPGQSNPPPCAAQRQSRGDALRNAVQAPGVSHGAQFSRVLDSVRCCQRTRCTCTPGPGPCCQVAGDGGTSRRLLAVSFEPGQQLQHLVADSNGRTGRRRSGAAQRGRCCQGFQENVSQAAPRRTRRAAHAQKNPFV